MRYIKKACTTNEHIALLQKRGLSIDDPDRALRYLESVSYYRLSGYMFHLQDKRKESTFYEGTTFGDVINLYTFDKQLCCIFLEYLERIEVCFRTRILNTYSVGNGFYWTLNNKHFIERTDIRDEKEEILSYKVMFLSRSMKSSKSQKSNF